MIFLSWVDFHAATYVLSDDGKLCSDLSDAEPVGYEDCDGPAAIAALKTIIPSLTRFNGYSRSNGHPKYCFFIENANNLFWNYGMYVGPKYGKVGCGEGIIANTDCEHGTRQICKKGKYQHHKNQVLNHDRYLE